MTEPPLWRGRWVLYAAGAAMVGYGTWGQLFGADTKPRRYAELLLVAALGHDLVLAPLVLLLGLAARKVLHRHVHGVLQGAALVGFALLVVALPGIGRYGARSDNTSILPRDYTSGLMVALGAVAVGAVLVLAVRLLRRSRG